MSLARREKSKVFSLVLCKYLSTKEDREWEERGPKKYIQGGMTTGSSNIKAG